MSNLIAVLDSCVLFPNILRDTLLTAFDWGLYQAYWSQSILDGVTRNLIKKKIINEKKAKYLENIVTPNLSNFEQIVQTAKNS